MYSLDNNKINSGASPNLSQSMFHTNLHLSKSMGAQKRNNASLNIPTAIFRKLPCSWIATMQSSRQPNLQTVATKSETRHKT